MSKIDIRSNNNKNVIINKKGEIISNGYETIYMSSSDNGLHIVSDNGKLNILLVNKDQTSTEELLSKDNNYKTIEPISFFSDESKTIIDFFIGENKDGTYDFFYIVEENKVLGKILNKVENVRNMSADFKGFIYTINGLEYIIKFFNNNYIKLEYGFKSIKDLKLNNSISYGIDSNNKYHYFYIDKDKLEFIISQTLTEFDNGSEYLGGGFFILEKEGKKGLFEKSEKTGDLLKITDLEYKNIEYLYSPSFNNNYYKMIDQNNNEKTYNIHRDNYDNVYMTEIDNFT